jgi:hypothetical protein
MVPFLCHIFLILFGSFFGLNLSLNKGFAQKSFGYENIQAVYMGRPLGFMMLGLVLIAAAALFQIGGITSANEVFSALFIFTVLGFLYNISLVMKILPTHDGNPHEIKNAIRPLIPMVVILIRYFSL